MKESGIGRDQPLIADDKAPEMPQLGKDSLSGKGLARIR
jgi:hypothetical protein